jgi:hypothetical protein
MTRTAAAEKSSEIILIFFAGGATIGVPGAFLTFQNQVSRTAGAFGVETTGGSSGLVAFGMLLWGVGSVLLLTATIAYGVVLGTRASEVEPTAVRAEVPAAAQQQLASS